MKLTIDGFKAGDIRQNRTGYDSCISMMGDYQMSKLSIEQIEDACDVLPKCVSCGQPLETDDTMCAYCEYAREQMECCEDVISWLFKS